MSDCANHNHQHITSSEHFFGAKGDLVNHDLEVLLEITGVQNKKNLQFISDAINNNVNGWLRTGERWEEQQNKFELISEQIYYLAAKLGYIDKISAAPILYDRAIIFGTDSTCADLRFDSMLEAWVNGATWKRTIILGSDRSLQQPSSDLLLLPKIIAENYQPTETGLMQYLFYQEYKDKFPKDLKQVPETFINTDKPSYKKRADTGDTIMNWIKKDSMSEIKKLLAFSNQPYINYQNKIIEFTLKSNGFNNIKVTTIGEGVHNKPHPIIILDAIARDLFFLNKIKNC